VGKSAQQVVEMYDTSLEAEKMAANAQMAVAGTAAVEVGAIGLGAAVAALASTVAIDVTGILAASIIAALGFFVIPAKRQSAKKDLGERVANLRTQLTSSLTGQFQKELNRSLGRINEATAPYTRFVRAEEGKLKKTEEGLTEASNKLGRLRAEIEGLA
jgi:hypothetical protein